MRIIRKASLTKIPWKNGGGITHEVMRFPAGGDSFSWRVSVAEVDASGPFSDFTGYRRLLVLLQGAGMRLSFEGGSQTVLHRIGDSAEFDGGIATGCELLAGGCFDLNLIVAKDLGVRTATLSVTDGRQLPEGSATTRLLFVIVGSLRLEALAGESCSLDRWDCALFAPGEGAVLRPPIDESVAPLVFCAALDDNPSRGSIRREVPWLPI